MELTQLKTLRWTVPLAKLILLQSVVISVSYAVTPIPAPTPVSLPDTRFTQLDLDEDASQTHGLDLYLVVTFNCCCEVFGVF